MNKIDKLVTFKLNKLKKIMYHSQILTDRMEISNINLSTVFIIDNLKVNDLI